MNKVSVIASACIFENENVKILYTSLLRFCLLFFRYFFFFFFITLTLPFLVRLLILPCWFTSFSHFLSTLTSSYFFFMSLFSFTHTSKHDNKNSNKTVFFSLFSFTVWKQVNNVKKHCHETCFFYIAYMYGRYIWYLYTDVKL